MALSPKTLLARMTASAHSAAGTLASGDGAPASPADVPGPATEMGFLDHLEELRWRIIKALAAVVLSAIACLFFAEWVIDRLLLGPVRADFFMYSLFRLEAVDVVLQNRTVTGQFFAYVGTVLATGIIIGSPIVVYQAWRFVEPGLYPHERRGLRFAAVAATFYFVLGILFGYLVLTPLALQFFAQFTISDAILNEFDISRYFSLVLTWTFGAGLLFELPVVVYFFSVIGVLTPARLRTGRKYALIGILVMAAFLTPPDPFSQVLMAVPLLGLYELSIWISARVQRRQLREAAAEQRLEEQRRAADAARAAESDE
jgi:sec-independent protein translocase protein TatC